MKAFFKKPIAVVLAVLIALSCISVAVFADAKYKGNFTTSVKFSREENGSYTDATSGSLVVKAGNKVKADIFVSSDFKVYDFYLLFNFDNSVLSYDTSKNNITGVPTPIAAFPNGAYSGDGASYTGYFNASNKAVSGNTTTVYFEEQLPLPAPCQFSDTLFCTVYFVVNDSLTEDTVATLDLATDYKMTPSYNGPLYASFWSAEDDDYFMMDDSDVEIKFNPSSEELVTASSVILDAGEGGVIDGTSDRTKTIKGVVGKAPEGLSTYKASAPGKEFLGWAESATATAPMTANELSAVKFGYTAKTLYAVYKEKTYTVTYTFDGSLPSDAQLPTDTTEYKYSETVTVKPAPATQIEGWAFDGWKKGADVVSSFVITEDTTLVGTWTYTAPKYKLVYKNEAGEILRTFEGEEGAAIDQTQIPAVPAKEGFNGAWSAEYTTMPKSTAADKATVVNPVYTAKTYTITFNTDGGSSVADITAKYDESVSAPSQPTKDNFIFKNWRDSSNNIFTFPYKMSDTGSYTEAIALKAEWEEKQYVVKYVDENENQVAVFNGPVGTPVTAPDVPEKVGYTGAWDKNISSIPAVEETIVRPVYTEKTYTIKFNTDGGSPVADITAKYTDSVAAPEKPTKDNFSFVRWVLDGSEFAFPYKMSDSGEYKAVINLKAEWKDIEYTVRYLKENGDTLQEFKGKVNTPIDAPAVPAKTGYNGEWSQNLDKIPAVDLTEITPVYTEKTYTITFDTDGGSAVGNITAKYTDSVAAPEKPTKDNFEFVRWTKDGAEFAFPYKMSDTGTYTETIALKAEWKDKEYTVNYLKENGDILESFTGKVGTPIVVPEVPAKTGYTGEWDKTVTEIPAVDITNVRPVYTPRQYTISFDTDGGTPVGNITAKYNETVSAPAAPTKDNFTFAGWTRDGADFVFPYNMSSSGVYTETVSLKAKWVDKVYTITFYATDNNGQLVVVDTETGANGTTFTVPAIPAREGWTPKEWTHGEGDTNTYAPGSTYTIAAKDDTLYASYDINHYDVTFMANGSVVASYPQQPYGSNLTALIPADPAPLSATDVFKGWDIDGDGKVDSLPATVPAHDLVAVAVFGPAGEFTVTYRANGKTYVRYSVTSGDPVPVPDSNPHSFARKFIGWDVDGDGTVDAIPAVMPAHDLVINAVFESDVGFTPVVIGGVVVAGGAVAAAGISAINAGLITGAALVGGAIILTGIAHLIKYTNTVTYMVDGTVYRTFKVVKGAKVPVPADPTKEGYTFTGWKENIPERMGSEDLVFHAGFVKGDSDVIPATGSTIVGATAAISLVSACAAAFVLKKKKEDEE
ncbi:MAG: InlB B-repeat-containing protein [Clostridiales bacterium]|nr:InlB B-repeat-containing protein [Clostridiales bacterium]